MAQKKIDILIHVLVDTGSHGYLSPKGYVYEDFIENCIRPMREMSAISQFFSKSVSIQYLFTPFCKDTIEIPTLSTTSDIAGVKLKIQNVNVNAGHLVNLSAIIQTARNAAPENSNKGPFENVLYFVISNHDLSNSLPPIDLREQERILCAVTSPSIENDIRKNSAKDLMFKKSDLVCGNVEVVAQTPDRFNELVGRILRNVIEDMYDCAPDPKANKTIGSALLIVAPQLKKVAKPAKAARPTKLTKAPKPVNLRGILYEVANVPKKVILQGLEKVTNKFEILPIFKKQTIESRVREAEAKYFPGRAYYELVKSEKVQSHKSILLRNLVTAEIYSGPKVRELLGLPPMDSGRTATIQEIVDKRWQVFVQSTSYTRILPPDTYLVLRK